MAAHPTITLNDGRAMPQIGLGVWQAPAEETAAIVQAAIHVGYRHIDTAAAYRNEAGVGEGVRASGKADEVFVTTKLWNNAHGYDAAMTAFDKSLERMGRDSVDLYLIHWPQPGLELYVETWRALIEMRAQGRAKSIGVSNFSPQQLDRLADETGVVPAVNQIELHPRFQQAAARAAHARLGIATESWSPLGRGALLSDPAITTIANRLGRTPAQVIVRWHIELGCIVIPKTTHTARMAENADVFDFVLTEQDLADIAQLDDPGGRMGPDPATFG